MNVLLCFRHETPQLSGAQIAALTGLPRSTTYRLAGYLVRRGLLAYDAQSRRYAPGFRLLELGSIAASEVELRRLAQPILAELREETGETVNVSVYHDDHRVCVEKLDSVHDIRGVIHVGKPYPLHAGAAGKVILAFLPDETVWEIIRRQGLAPYTPRTQTEIGPLLRSLAEIRRAGVAVTESERVPGATGVSAPVFDRAGTVIASVTVSGPSFRFTPDRIEAYRRLVARAAERLTRAHGGRPPVPMERASP